ncbi:defective transmitter release [Carabus blaptoides fortunei]
MSAAIEQMAPSKRNEVLEEELLANPRMTKKFILAHCKEHKLYQTPYLNDVLYLHFKGFRTIENLEEYVGLKCLWLESNGIDRISGLAKQTALRSLYLHQNLIKKIENLSQCVVLDTLNLAQNQIRTIENLDCLKVLHSLNLSKNYLESLEDLEHLALLKEVSVLDLSHNQIADPLVVEVLADMPELRVLNLMGNPVIRNIPAYRKTLTLRLPNLQYLDDRPVFPQDRACAEAWQRGGAAEEHAERRRWFERGQRRILDSVNALLRLRDERRSRSSGDSGMGSSLADLDLTDEEADASDATSDVSNERLVMPLNEMGDEEIQEAPERIFVQEDNARSNASGDGSILMITGREEGEIGEDMMMVEVSDERRMQENKDDCLNNNNEKPVLMEEISPEVFKKNKKSPLIHEISSEDSQANKKLKLIIEEFEDSQTVDFIDVEGLERFEEIKCVPLNASDDKKMAVLATEVSTIELEDDAISMAAKQTWQEEIQVNPAKLDAQDSTEEISEDLPPEEEPEKIEYGRQLATAVTNYFNCLEDEKKLQDPLINTVDSPISGSDEEDLSGDVVERAQSSMKRLQAYRREEMQLSSHSDDEYPGLNWGIYERVNRRKGGLRVVTLADQKEQIIMGTSEESDEEMEYDESCEEMRTAEQSEESLEYFETEDTHSCGTEGKEEINVCEAENQVDEVNYDSDIEIIQDDEETEDNYEVIDMEEDHCDYEDRSNNNIDSATVREMDKISDNAQSQKSSSLSEDIDAENRQSSLKITVSDDEVIDVHNSNNVDNEDTQESPIDVTKISKYLDGEQSYVDEIMWSPCQEQLFDAVTDSNTEFLKYYFSNQLNLTEDADTMGESEETEEMQGNNTSAGKENEETKELENELNRRPIDLEASTEVSEYRPVLESIRMLRHTISEFNEQYDDFKLKMAGQQKNEKNEKEFEENDKEFEVNAKESEENQKDFEESDKEFEENEPDLNKNEEEDTEQLDTESIVPLDGAKGGCSLEMQLAFEDVD